MKYHIKEKIKIPKLHMINHHGAKTKALEVKSSGGKTTMSEIIAKAKAKNPERFGQSLKEKGFDPNHKHKELSDQEKRDYQRKVGRAYNE